MFKELIKTIGTTIKIMLGTRNYNVVGVLSPLINIYIVPYPVR